MATTSIANVSNTINSSYVLIIFPLPQDSERVVPPFQLPWYANVAVLGIKNYYLQKYILVYNELKCIFCRKERMVWMNIWTHSGKTCSQPLMLILKGYSKAITSRSRKGSLQHLRHIMMNSYANGKWNLSFRKYHQVLLLVLDGIFLT